MPCFVFVLFVFSRAVRHQVLKGTRFVCLFFCFFVFLFFCFFVFFVFFYRFRTLDADWFAAWWHVLCCPTHCFRTRLALVTVVGPFGLHLLTFTLPTPVLWCTIWGYWNFRLEFVTRHTSQHTRYLPNLTCDCDLWKHLVFRLLLSLFRLMGLSKRKDYLTISHWFHRISFCSRVYMYVHRMRYLTSRSTWARRV